MTKPSSLLAPSAPLSPYRFPGARNPARVYLASLPSPGSRRVQRAALKALVRLVDPDERVSELTWETFPWHELRYQHTQVLRAKLLEKLQEGELGAATINRMLVALRRVLKECWRLGLLDAETYRQAADLPSVKAETLPRGRALSAGELRALVSSCAEQGGTAGARDLALLALLYGAGLRRAEVVSLDVRDYDMDDGTLRVRAGKGRKARIVPIPPGARRAMEGWLALRGFAPGPLLKPITRGGTILERRLTAEAIRRRCLFRARRSAGVAPFSPHDLRRSYVSDLLDAGADIATVQKMAGHVSPATTSRYDRRGEKAKAKAAELLHFPEVSSG